MLWLMLLFFNTENFKEAEHGWRAQREESLKGSDSWFNIVGLFWLKEGSNPFGTQQGMRLFLPPHSTVAKAGVFYLEEGKVSYEMARGQRATVAGEPRNKGTLNLDEVIEHNHLRMFPIKRSGRVAIRVRDMRAREYLDFEALKFYRPKEKYVVEGVFQPFDPPEKITITTVVSTQLEMYVPGVIHFDLHGKTLELRPTLETLEDERYLIMFQDQTSGTTTYGGGRFLYVDPPVDGKITLNFNRAINPPCAYTHYATCPLPPAENWLDIPIEAGEKTYLTDDQLP